ncbi:MAG: SUMF1/EgtB/PvdO family nonheme iron enzyme [Gammaproteobacteria bacterium]|nr:SUMF1/EgtB/PvdO family nonheme iron enzyme [Gammaproteobacteria bacterium]MCP5138099.1 SUMF1/EgtB/PvdO family nonheme iron enzyme [Gammaproteobacteria bacterium]
MSSGKIFIIRDADGERRADERDLPFALGRGDEAHLRLPGLGEDAVHGWIAFDRGHAFIQTGDDEHGLFHNRRHLSGSTWLKSGDIVQVAGALLSWRVDGDQVFIDIEEDVTPAPPPVMRPPSAPPPDAAPVFEEPLPHVAADRPHRSAPPWLIRSLIGAAVVIVLAALFVMLATPFELHIQPEPDRQSIDGFPPPFHLGGRLMALPGAYRVQAEKAGYLPLTQEIRVESGAFRRHEFALQELPGWLRLNLSPAVTVQVSVDGQVLSAAADGRYGLPPGEHTLRIEAERYLPETRQIVIVGRDEQVTESVSLKPAWARVGIDSEPGDAEIHLDGAVIGRTPLSVEVVQGTHELTLQKALFKPLQRKLQVQAGQDQDLGKLALEPADGELVLSSDPSGATVTLDGAYLGVTPLQTPVKAGVAHRLVFSKVGRENLEIDVQVEAEQRRSEHVALTPEFGVVFLNTQPVDAELSIDGKSVGTATRRLRLPTRTHRLEIRKAGYLPERIEVTPRTDIAQRLNVVLKTPKQVETAKQEAAKVDRQTSGAGQTLRLIEPSGSFEMGASRREAGRRANESERLVALTRPYFLSEKEVTNAQYQAFKPGHDSGFAEGQTLNRPEQPVVDVSWDDAARYCNWLSVKDGLPPAYVEAKGKLVPVTPMNTGYRLPSEAEWAYAARVAGRPTPVRYAWGEGFPPPANAGNWADKRIDDVFAVTVPNYDDGFRVSAPVGSFAPNPAGLYDMGGNVAEWTGDWYAVYPGEASTAIKDPVGPPTGEHHVVKDTGWKHGSIGELRLAYRDYSQDTRNDLGFRVARYVY